MTSLLPATRSATVKQVVLYSVHGQPHYQILYAPVGDEDRTFAARLGNESVYEGIAAGDQVMLHILMNLVTRIEKV
jgi:hypothetical protein